jgi:hypothetical protein
MSVTTSDTADKAMTSRCVLCGESLGDGSETITITQKGADGVNSASVHRGTPTVLVSAGQVIHVNCRKKHIDQKCIKLAKRKRDSDVPARPQLRSQVPEFAFKSHCFLCGTKITSDDKHDIDDIFYARSFDFQRSILFACDERNDEWADTVRRRVVTRHHLRLHLQWPRS